MKKFYKYGKKHAAFCDNDHLYFDNFWGDCPACDGRGRETICPLCKQKIVEVEAGSFCPACGEAFINIEESQRLKYKGIAKEIINFLKEEGADISNLKINFGD